MTRSMRLFSARVCFAALALAACIPLLQAQQLQTLKSPTGSTIVYGQVADQTTEAGAMAAILRHVHQDVGEKPQVGTLFQVRGTESVAVFFSAMRHTGTQVRIAGLIIATKVSTDRVEAALVTDEAVRFHKVLSANMKALFAVWHPLRDQAAREGSGGSGAPVEPLQQRALPDNSAGVKLPADWKILPRLSGGGTICASGPNAETAFLGITFLAEDTNYPAVQRLERQLQAGALRNTSYASAAYVPYGADPKKVYVYLFNHSRASGGMPPADFNILSAAAMPSSGPMACTHMTGTVDFKDQHGTREMDAIFCTHPPRPAGVWLSQAFVTTVPTALAQKEKATLGAILQSFSVNQAVVDREAGQIAGPIINQIHAIGAAAAANANAAHRAEDIHNSSVYQHWDSMDKRSQEFENYQLGFSVISDNQNTAHGTFWNEDAEALIKSNPDRFEYVSAPNYWKGIDY